MLELNKVEFNYSKLEDSETENERQVYTAKVEMKTEGLEEALKLVDSIRYDKDITVESVVITKTFYVTFEFSGIVENVIDELSSLVYKVKESKKEVKKNE